MSTWGGAGSSWQYSRWMKNTARNARITNPTGLEAMLYRIMVGFFCNPITNTGTRLWLLPAFFRKAVAGKAGSEYECNLATEPIHVIVGLTEVIGRDLKKIPLTDAEKAVLDAVWAFQETILGVNRRYGTKPLYGNVGGSTVAVP